MGQAWLQSARPDPLKTDWNCVELGEWEVGIGCVELWVLRGGTFKGRD